MANMEKFNIGIYLIGALTIVTPFFTFAEGTINGNARMNSLFKTPSNRNP